MPVAEVQKAPATGAQEAEEAVRREVAAVLDFDMLCATVALQTQGMSLGKSRRKEAVTEEGDEDEEMEFGSVQRMWEGDVTDCFDDRRIAIETACFIAFGITNRHYFLYMAIASTISSGLYLGHFRSRLKKRFNIRVLSQNTHYIAHSHPLYRVNGKKPNISEDIEHGYSPLQGFGFLYFKPRYCVVRTYYTESVVVQPVK
ncbi:hypothetical protein BHE74_00039029 [Ensete ventricosum]|nr:hypothetical protein BHE74_00039029 [Ensete ventricosum]